MTDEEVARKLHQEDLSAVTGWLQPPRQVRTVLKYGHQSYSMLHSLHALSKHLERGTDVVLACLQPCRIRT